MSYGDSGRLGGDIRFGICYGTLSSTKRLTTTTASPRTALGRCLVSYIIGIKLTSSTRYYWLQDIMIHSYFAFIDKWG